MAGGIDWFRWHHGSVTDPKFQLVARKSKQALASVIAVWAFVLEQASASEDRGAFGAIDCEAIDCLLGLEDGATAAILAAMGERGLVDDGAVSAWEKRQPKRERTDNTSTERSRAHRDRQRQEQQDGEKQRHATPELDDATPCNATQHQKKPRGEESREEKNSPSLRSGEVRASRLPTDWQLPDSWREWATAERPDLDVRRAAAGFADYWHAKPGKDGRKTDWLATWRNWVRNERAPPQARASPPASKHAAAARAIYGAPSNPEFIDVETVVRQH